MRIFGIGVVALALATGGCTMTGGVPRDRLVAEPTACTAQRFEIYFADGEARLTPVARQTIGLMTTQLRGCAISRVQVLGLADGRGATDANQTLSQRRALAVSEALAATGWPTPVFEVLAAGDQGAVVGSGVAEPLRRRVEVLVDAAPR